MDDDGDNVRRGDDEVDSDDGMIQDCCFGDCGKTLRLRIGG